MFKARFVKYWYDYCKEYVTLRFNNVEEILEYVYQIHKHSNNPYVSQFNCRGDRKNCGGYLNADCSLDEKYGYRGSVWLESITYSNNSEEIIIFDKYDRYISPKTSKIFDEFAAKAKQRNQKIYGDFLKDF